MDSNKTIIVSRTVIARLDSMRESGESYDSVLRRVFELGPRGDRSKYSWDSFEMGEKKVFEWDRDPQTHECRRYRSVIASLARFQFKSGKRFQYWSDHPGLVVERIA